MQWAWSGDRTLIGAVYTLRFIANHSQQQLYGAIF